MSWTRASRVAVYITAAAAAKKEEEVKNIYTHIPMDYIYIYKSEGICMEEFILLPRLLNGRHLTATATEVDSNFLASADIVCQHCN